ncbi:MAG: nucleoside hydrolase, partial [Shewanella sp.]
PLTNIALLLAAHPELKLKIARIVLMGGAAGAGTQSLRTHGNKQSHISIVLIRLLIKLADWRKNPLRYINTALSKKRYQYHGDALIHCPLPIAHNQAEN